MLPTVLLTGLPWGLRHGRPGIPEQHLGLHGGYFRNSGLLRRRLACGLCAQQGGGRRLTDGGVTEGRRRGAGQGARRLGRRRPEDLFRHRVLLGQQRWWPRMHVPSLKPAS